MDDSLISLEMLRLAQDAPACPSPSVKYEILVCLEGRLELSLAGRSASLEPCAGAFVLPGEVRTYHLARANGAANGRARAAVLRLPGESLQIGAHGWIGQRLDEASCEARMGYRSDPVILASFRNKLERLVAPVDPSAEAFRSSLAESLALDLCLDFLGGKKRGADAPRWLRKACGVMEQNCNLESGGGRLPEVAGKSAGYVIRQMRLHYGMTPTQFVNDLRMRRARELLTSSDQAVLDISYSIGFENPSYFARLFRKKYGLPPRRFRAGQRV